MALALDSFKKTARGGILPVFSFLEALEETFKDAEEGKDEITSAIIQKDFERLKLNWCGMEDKYRCYRHQDTGLSYLHLAVMKGDLDIVKYLTEMGMDVTETAYTRTSDVFWNLSCLHIAIGYKHKHLLPFIRNLGCDIECPLYIGSDAKECFSNLNGMSAIHFAVLLNDSATLTQLIDWQAQVNVQSNCGFTPLHIAAMLNYQHIAQILLKKKIIKDAPTKEGATPVFLAAEHNSQRVLSLLLQHGHNANTETSEGYKALHAAAENGSVDAVILLSKAGCYLNDRADAKREYFNCSVRGATPLHLAAAAGKRYIVEALLKQGADPNTVCSYHKDGKEEKNMTALHLSTMHNSEMMCRLLVNNGARIDVKTSENNSPLLICTRNNYLDIGKLLLEHGADVNEDNGRPLLTAIEENQLDFCDLLLRQPDIQLDLANSGLVRDTHSDTELCYNVTPLHLAVENQMKDLVEKLLNRGADVNTKMAQNDGHAPSFSLLHTIAAARLENVELAKTVLDFGCSINEKTLDGETALMKASKPKPFINLAKLFIESGADVNLADKQGFTPLLNVVYSKDPNLELIELLIKSGRCDLERVTCQDHHGCAAIHYAIIYRNLKIAKLLIENRCDVNIRTSCLQNSTTPNKATPLVLAIQKFTGDELAEIVKVLLKNEADTMLTYEASGSELFGLRTTEHLELTPLHTAALNDNMINVMRMLIKHGADVNAASPTGCPITPLSVAIRKGNLNAAELLIKKGATVTPVFDETFSSYQGLDRYPFNLAVEFGRRDLLDLLADFGAKIFKPAQIDANIGRDKEPLTPLALACSNNSADGLVQQVIRIGADVRDNSPKDTPPLHIAVLDLSEPRCDAAVKTLLQYGADADISVDYRSSKRISVLNQATESGFANTARLLMQAGADILRPHYDSELGTNVVPAFNVSRRGETFQDTLLFNHGTDINHCGYRSVNILHYVVGTTDEEVLELLLKYGVDADELGGIAGTDNQPEGSLMKPLQMMIFNDLSNEETAKILLRYSTAVNWRCMVGSKRYSTLMLCVSENDDETARLLVRYGADVNYQERKSGESSLLMAVRDGDSDCFKVLMEAACDVDLPSDLGITPLIQATMIGQVEMVRRLIGAGCDVNATCTSGEPDADDNRDNEEGEQFCHDSTALHQAVELGFTKIVKMLLEAGALTEAKENHKGSPGFTPLHCATVTSHKEIVEILLDAKCKINAQTDEGLTALHLSVKEDDMPMAKMLFERGVNPMIKTKEGKLASELSQRMHFTQELLGYEMKWTFLHQRPTLQRKRLSLHQRLSMQNLGLFRMNALNIPVAEAAGGELPTASQRTERAVQGVSQ